MAFPAVADCTLQLQTPSNPLLSWGEPFSQLDLPACAPCCKTQAGEWASPWKSAPQYLLSSQGSGSLPEWTLPEVALVGGFCQNSEERSEDNFLSHLGFSSRLYLEGFQIEAKKHALPDPPVAAGLYWRSFSAHRGTQKLMFSFPYCDRGSWLPSVTHSPLPNRTTSLFELPIHPTQRQHPCLT